MHSREVIQVGYRWKYIFGFFDTFIDSAKCDWKTGSGSDTSQITDSSDADAHILIIIKKISIWVCGNEGERHLKGG